MKISSPYYFLLSSPTIHFHHCHIFYNILFFFIRWTFSSSCTVLMLYILFFPVAPQSVYLLKHLVTERRSCEAHFSFETKERCFYILKILSSVPHKLNETYFLSSDVRFLILHSQVHSIFSISWLARHYPVLLIFQGYHGWISVSANTHSGSSMRFSDIPYQGTAYFGPAASILAFRSQCHFGLLPFRPLAILVSFYFGPLPFRSLA